MSTDRTIRVIEKDDFSVIRKVNVNMDKEKIYEYVIRFTEMHQKFKGADKNERELACLKVMFPYTFQPVHPSQYTIGALYVMPVGIGCTTTVGGVGYYAQWNILEDMKEGLKQEDDIRKWEEVLAYWREHDSREQFFADNLIEDELGRFVDTRYPAIVTARLSGMYLDYDMLCELGVSGLRQKIMETKSMSSFHQSLLGCLDIFTLCIEHLADNIRETCDVEEERWKCMLIALNQIKEEKPKSFLEALQLTWIYSLVSGVINYGRMDDYLGDFLVADLDQGQLSWEEALHYVRSLFDHMEQRRTLANSRVIIGGKGRKSEKNADVFCKLAIQAVMENHDIEPQLTLRYYKGMAEEVYDLALDCIASGTTFPILYNDDVNIPALMEAMNIDEATATNYVPLGCGEINLSGCGVSTPNTCINMLKVLSIAMNEGIDPFDQKKKNGNLLMKPLSTLHSFEEFYEQYKELMCYYIKICAKGQKESYVSLNNNISFLFTSMLTNDCITSGKPVLGGGVRYLGGTNETYGNISTGDALYAIKKLVYEDKKFTLEEIGKACIDDFIGHESILNAMMNLEYYGNDVREVDEVHEDLHNFVCGEVRRQALKVGMDYYLVVMINNQIGTQWGLDTWASANGRKAKTYMSNGNNPQSGKDHNGPTAMLSSLTKLSPKIHAGAVQNMKFSKELFNEHREMIKVLLDVYFEKGAQIMISVVGKEELEEAYHCPQKYPNLIVRVGGFSARFVDLNKEVQKEILERTLN